MDPKDASVDTSSLQVAIELELRKAGIRVLNTLSYAPTAVIVAIEGLALRTRSGIIYSMDLQVSRAVSTVAWPCDPLLGRVWHALVYAGVAPDDSKLAELLRGAVTRDAQELANEILKANGR
jgi:hypothetical protein